jgi:hypothetical protein
LRSSSPLPSPLRRRTAKHVLADRAMAAAASSPGAVEAAKACRLRVASVNLPAGVDERAWHAIDANGNGLGARAAWVAACCSCPHISRPFSLSLSLSLSRVFAARQCPSRSCWRSARKRSRPWAPRH